MSQAMEMPTCLLGTHAITHQTQEASSPNLYLGFVNDTREAATHHATDTGEAHR